MRQGLLGIRRREWRTISRGSDPEQLYSQKLSQDSAGGAEWRRGAPQFAGWTGVATWVNPEAGRQGLPTPCKRFHPNVQRPRSKARPSGRAPALAVAVAPS